MNLLLAAVVIIVLAWADLLSAATVTVSLSWTDTNTTEDGTKIYREIAGTFQQVGEVGPNVTSFNETFTASEGAQLKYHVRPYQGSELAPPSSEWVGVVPGLTPTCGTIGLNQFTGCYYNNMDFTNLVLTRTDPTINFDWGMGSPDPSVGVDEFSVRWEGDFDFAQSGTYRFSASADDGIRVFLDGAQIIESWVDQSETLYTSERSVTAGRHRIRVEYYENGYGAVAKTSWSLVGSPSPPATAPSPACPSVGLNNFVGCYYNNIDFTSLVLTRTDAAINFDWGAGSPDPGYWC